jgi:hypothetical protein
LSGIYPLKNSEGCWKREKSRVDVDESNKEPVKKEVIESKVGSAGNGVEKHLKWDRQQNP